MKLINYNYGCAIEKSSTWYRGKIEMSRNEWRDVQIYLGNPKVVRMIYPYTQSLPVADATRMLRDDIDRAQTLKDGSKILTVRVPCTDAIVRRFKPLNARRYKRNNYFIHVRA